MGKIKIDETDQKILKILQADARTSNADIARQVHLVPSATLERVKRLEKIGVIKGYHATIDTSLLDYNLLAFVNIKTDTTACVSTIVKELKKFDQVQEIHHVAGDDCYLLKIRAANVPRYSKFLHNTILKIDGVLDSRSVIVMDTSKECAGLDLEDVFYED